MRKLIVLALVVVTAAGAWWYASPLWTLSQIRDAAERKDAAAVSDHVDYPALREDTKAQMRAKLADEVAKGPGEGMEALGSGLALMMLDPMIDAMVTPEMLAASFKSKAAADRSPLPKLGKDEEPTVVRQGLDRFVVRGADGNEGGFVFERRGLSWKVVGMELPVEAEEATAE